MDQWEGTFGDQRKVIEAQTVRMREFAAQTEVAQRAVRALEEFQVQITRDQKQVSELQRLAEERQRKELTNWQGENEQRWKKELLRWDYAMQEQQKINQKIVDRFPPLEKITVWLQKDLEALWKLQDIVGSQQLLAAQQMLNVLGKGVEERPKMES